ncbi:S-layer homology domain-containing protein [Cohnella sp. OV330]|uniref:S-layer homology domain-containing protein n=1 Tax=Cohnella sp. OV330 TaxID=1855288 RepID=UPI0008EF3675|nr:S-layer homology domain-containing protein [Cohnella sp. OV330]SFB56445.1 S-layer homology domain-containing protein [Cohnella sp. OV330]
MIATTTFGARNVLAAPSVSSEQTSFKDIGPVPADRQAAINQAVSLGLISGYPNGEFKPDESLTRTQLAVLLAKALKLSVDTNAGSTFKDVASDSWSVGYIEAVRKAGLMNGSNAGFEPNRKITRQELASVFVRAVNGQNTTGGLETDPALAAEASGWASASVQTALRLGLMTPQTNGFEPRQEVARADIAQFLVDIFPEKEQTATVTKVDGDVITINGTPLLVSDALKRLLLGDGNIEALQGAVLRFKSAVRSLNDLSELEIVAAGKAGSSVKLDTTGMPAGATLKISGDYVAISGGSVTNLTLQNQAANVSVDAIVDHLKLTGQTVTLSGKGSYGEIEVTNSKAKLTLGSDVRITRLVLPDGVALTDIVTNPGQVQAQIGSIVSASGVPVSKPSASVSNSAPIVADTRTLDAAIEEASSLADAAVAGGAEGQYQQSAIDALNVAIATAKETKASAGAAQAEIDGAAASLRTAIHTFKVAVVHVGTARLDAAIEEASGVAHAAVAGGAEGQYPQSAIDVLNDAIETAAVVKGDAEATQAEINGATATLQEAIDAFKKTAVHIDLTQLAAAIADAWDLVDAAVAGTEEGQYPQSAIDALNDAIQAAEEVKAKAGVIQSEIDSAKAALQDAITAFEDVSSPSLKASLEGRPFYLNSGRTGTTGDTFLSTDSYEQYNKRSIKNYLQIKRGAVSETIEYDTVNKQFTVTESGSGVVGTITVESTSPLVELTPDSSGITIHPLDAATESTEAALVFHVKQGNEEVSQVTLPIVMDETVPTLSSSVYGNDQFTLTANELLTTSIMGYSLQVQFSQSGNAVDFEPLTVDTQYSVEFVDKRIIITLRDGAKALFVPQSSSKFRIVATGITDHAGNALSVDSTIDVPQY